MNLSEFRALLAEYMIEYALENPNRPLSTVTVRDFDAWLERRSPFDSAIAMRYAALRRDLNFGFPGSLGTTPADETDEQIRERIARERPAPDTHGLANTEALGCPHCGATNGEHKSHGRFRCMGGTFSLSDARGPVPK